MDPRIYSWNTHEQQHRPSLPSPCKIKIQDDVALRLELEQVLEKLPHRSLAIWALEQASSFLIHLDSHLAEDPRIQQAIIVFEQRIARTCSAYEMRQAGFLANQLAKESVSERSKYAARTFAQAIAAGHMRGHAIVSADYSIKTINLIAPQKLEPVVTQRLKQIETAKKRRILTNV
ncbi:hypothetical protein NRIC_11560 [Enterococcus florum]|uniref:Imm-5-like domain-containing protein n=1 Tax=Enterococcus florum TaxID=2480627 RepID=A0A4P5P5X2_9ENTE|nr:hypothetical protein [Enterococcus florum]GCF93265.1 hypothetical protein NRIC_11560 [Enterococcus florum]